MTDSKPPRIFNGLKITYKIIHIKLFIILLISYTILFSTLFFMACVFYEETTNTDMNGFVFVIMFLFAILFPYILSLLHTLCTLTYQIDHDGIKVYRFRSCILGFTKGSVASFPIDKIKKLRIYQGFKHPQSKYPIQVRVFINSVVGNHDFSISDGSRELFGGSTSLDQAIEYISSIALKNKTKLLIEDDISIGSLKNCVNEYITKSKKSLVNEQ